jgi:glycosyltransferase involved in cell wall biosynthesis
MASGEPGGGATYLKGLLPELARLDVQSSLITEPGTALASDITDLGFSVHTLDLMKSRFSLHLAKTLSDQIQKIKPTLVHAHGTRAAFYCALASIHEQCPVFYTAHGLAFRDSQAFWKRWVMTGVEWFAIQKLSGLASVSEQDLSSLKRLNRNGALETAYIPNAVDGRTFKPGNSSAARQLLGLPADAFVIGTVSRLVEQKAVDVLLRAAEQVAGCHLVIVGDGPLETPLRKQAEKAGLICHFLGTRTDIPDLLPAFDVFVLSSLWEGEPLSLLEALACGLAVVATDTPGACAILKQGEAGLLVPRGSSTLLGAALVRLSQNETLRKSMAVAAIEAASERTLAKTAAKTIEVYTKGLEAPCQ